MSKNQNYKNDDHPSLPLIIVNSGNILMQQLSSQSGPMHFKTKGGLTSLCVVVVIDTADKRFTLLSNFHIVQTDTHILRLGEALKPLLSVRTYKIHAFIIIIEAHGAAVSQIDQHINRMGAFFADIFSAIGSLQSTMETFRIPISVATDDGFAVSLIAQPVDSEFKNIFAIEKYDDARREF